MAIVAIKPKVNEFLEGPALSKRKEPVKIFPHVTMRHEFFPETKKWEVGKEYIVTLKLKMTGLSISKFSNESDFDIIGVDYNTKEESK